MSSVAWSSLHPAIRASIGRQVSGPSGGPSCGCTWSSAKDVRVWLCSYHDGMEDGAEAAAGLPLRGRAGIELVVGERLTGRIADLVRWAADERADGPARYIVCVNGQRCRQTALLAEGMGATIRPPVVWPELVAGRGGEPSVGAEYAIDNLADILTAAFGRGRIAKVVW